MHLSVARQRGGGIRTYSLCVASLKEGTRFLYLPNRNAGYFDMLYHMSKSAPLQTNCIVYLIRGDETSLCQLERSLSLLKENFLPWSPADIIVFHEANLDPAKLQGLTPGLTVRPVLVDFSAVPPALADVPVQSRGYRHMCHFFGNDIFLRAELASYEYYMRLDDDSFVLSPLRYNVFARMREKGFHYAYRVQMKDRPHVCVGLGDAVKAYFVQTPHLGVCDDPPPYRLYYTNFEICDLAWFRGPAWQSYFSAIDRAEGIWRHRWGDAPIRYYGVRNLLPPEKIWQVLDLHYHHQSEWLPGHRNRTFAEAVRHYLRTLWTVARARLSCGK